MTKRSKTKRRFYFKPIRPSFAIYLAYKKRIQLIIDRIVSDILADVSRLYKKEESNIINDASITKQFESLIRSKVKFWKDYTAKRCQKICSDVIDEVDSHNKSVIKNSLKTLPDEIKDSLVVEMSVESRNIMNAKQSLLLENVELIKSIPEYFSNAKVLKIVMNGIQRGNDYSYVEKELKHQANISTGRAKLIARDQINKATGIINNQRLISLNIEKSQWKHSKGDKVPRQDHLAADGKVYNTAEGCLISGEYILPGEKINCTCFSVPFIEF